MYDISYDFLYLSENNYKNHIEFIIRMNKTTDYIVKSYNTA